MNTKRFPFLNTLFILVLALPAIGAAQECASYIPEPAANHFVLVVDRSGSMSGQPITDARLALRRFVQSARPADSIALISFSDSISLDQNLGTDRNRILSRIDRLQPGGGTHLYDAVAAGVRMLAGIEGQKVVVYLTDGNDNGSILSARELHQMNIGENVFVYGVGLGDVDHQAIRGLSEATSGEYLVANSSRDLGNLYDRVQQNHYRRVDEQLSSAGAVTITSLPAGRNAFLDGSPVGVTPVRVDVVTPGIHRIEVSFDRGIWTCDAPVRQGYRNVVRARETDVPVDLVIESAPTRAAAFVDGTYVGLTTMVPSQTVNGRLDYTNQLRIESIAPGTHRIKLIAAPEFPMGAGGFSSSQIQEFDVTVRDRTLYVKGLIFMSQVQYADGRTERTPPLSGGAAPNVQSGGAAPNGQSGGPASGGPGGGIPGGFPTTLFGN